MTGVILLTKLFGFFKQMFTAASFGASIETDLVNLSQTFVSNLQYVLMSALATSFVSVYIFAKEKDRDGSRRFAADTAKVFLLVTAAVVVLVELFAPWLARLIAPSYSAELSTVLTRYLRIFAPALLLFVFIAISASTLDANKRFIPGQLEGFNQSVLLILCIFLFKDRLGIRTLVLAFFVYTLYNTVFLGVASRRYWGRSRGNPFRNPSVRALLKMIAPLMIGYSVVYVNELVAKMLVSGLDAGSVTAIGYGSVLSNLVTTFIAAFGSILFPYVTDHISTGHDREAAELADNTALLMIMVFLPVSVVFGFCAKDIVQVVFGRGAFDARAVEITARALVGYSVSFAPMVLREVYCRVQYGYQDSKWPMLNSTIGILANIGLSILLCPRYGVLGVAFASSVSVVICGVMNIITARRHNRYLNYCLILKWLPLLLAAGAVCALVCFGGNRLLAEWRPLLRLVVTGAAAVVLYALVALPLVLRMVPRVLTARAQDQSEENAE